MDIVRETVKRKLKEVLGIDEVAADRAVMRSRNPKNGDVMVPFSQFTTNSEDPLKVEDLLKENLLRVEKSLREETSGILSRVCSSELVLYVFADKKNLASRIIRDVLEQKEKFGSSEEGRGKKILVEFSSPNIAKVFHAGHLRTTILGNYIQNIYRKKGYTVISINYLGDWGRQFGLLGIGYAKYGDPEEMKKDSIRHLHDVYVRTNQDAEKDPAVLEAARDFFRKMEQGDEQSLMLWRKFRNLSIEQYKKVYAEMNVHFDVYSGESFYGEEAQKEVSARSYAIKCPDGSIIADLDELGKTVLVKQNGSTLYLTRDIAVAEDRIRQYSPYKSIYVVASQQDLHFKQLFRILEQGGHDPSLFLHISFGMVRGMSTRKGQVVFLSDVIETAKEAVLEKMNETEKSELIENKEETARILAISSIVVQDFKAKRVKDYTFDMKKNTSFIGDTGPYIQYTLCRLSGIFRNAMQMQSSNAMQSNSATQDPIGTFDDLDFSHLVDPRCYELVFELGRYPAVLSESLRLHEPSVVITYILQICKMVNSIFRVIWVANQDAVIARPRLAMYEAARIVLSDAVRVLGMVPLERM